MAVGLVDYMKSDANPTVPSPNHQSLWSSPLLYLVPIISEKTRLLSSPLLLPFVLALSLLSYLANTAQMSSVSVICMPPITLVVTATTLTAICPSHMHMPLMRLISFVITATTPTAICPSHMHLPLIWGSCHIGRWHWRSCHLGYWHWGSCHIG